MFTIKKLNIAELIDAYAPMLTEKQREVLELYYFEDLSLAEIAKNCGISRQGVHDAIKRGESVILEMEERLGMVKKSVHVSSLCECVQSEVANIRVYNQSTNRDRIELSLSSIEAAIQEINQ